MTGTVPVPDVPGEGATEPLDIVLIRGGTSRGVFIREEDLPAAGGDRDRRILRLFGRDGGTLADGIGGENPILRKVALVSRRPSRDGIPTVGYRFGQVSADLRQISFDAECGNISAGVPLFASLQGWAGSPQPGSSLWMKLLNTGRDVRAEWLEANGKRGRVRLGFVDPAPSDVLPLGEATVDLPADPDVACSVVRAMNDYVFLESSELGVDDPLGPEELAESSYARLERLQSSVRERLGGDRPIKMCLVARSSEDAGAVRCRIVYPKERRTHPAFAVTGAVTLGVARCLAGSRVAAACPDPPSGRLSIRHPSGTLDIEWTERSDGLPAEVALERSTRLILSGTAH